MSLVNKPASIKYPATSGPSSSCRAIHANSLIFKRITAGEMPPPSSDVTNPIPHPTISDMSVLQQWIMWASGSAGGAHGRLGWRHELSLAPAETDLT